MVREMTIKRCSVVHCENKVKVTITLAKFIYVIFQITNTWHYIAECYSKSCSKRYNSITYLIESGMAKVQLVIVVVWAQIFWQLTM